MHHSSYMNNAFHQNHQYKQDAPGSSTSLFYTGFGRNSPQNPNNSSDIFNKSVLPDQPSLFMSSPPSQIPPTPPPQIPPTPPTSSYNASNIEQNSVSNPYRTNRGRRSYHTTNTLFSGNSSKSSSNFFETSSLASSASVKSNLLSDNVQPHIPSNYQPFSNFPIASNQYTDQYNTLNTVSESQTLNESDRNLGELMKCFENDSKVSTSTVKKPLTKEERREVRERARKARLRIKNQDDSTNSFEGLISEISSQGTSLCSDVSADIQDGKLFTNSYNTNDFVDSTQRGELSATLSNQDHIQNNYYYHNNFYNSESYGNTNSDNKLQSDSYNYTEEHLPKTNFLSNAFPHSTDIADHKSSSFTEAHPETHGDISDMTSSYKNITPLQDLWANSQHGYIKSQLDFINDNQDLSKHNDQHSRTFYTNESSADTNLQASYNEKLNVTTDQKSLYNEQFNFPINSKAFYFSESNASTNPQDFYINESNVPTNSQPLDNFYQNDFNSNEVDQNCESNKTELIDINEANFERNKIELYDSFRNNEPYSNFREQFRNEEASQNLQDKFPSFTESSLVIRHKSEIPSVSSNDLVETHECQTLSSLESHDKFSSKLNLQTFNYDNIVENINQLNVSPDIILYESAETPVNDNANDFAPKNKDQVVYTPNEQMLSDDEKTTSGGHSSYDVLSQLSSGNTSRISPYQLIDAIKYPAPSSLNSNNSSPLEMIQNVSIGSSLYEKVNAASSGSINTNSFDLGEFTPEVVNPHVEKLNTSEEENSINKQNLLKKKMFDILNNAEHAGRHPISVPSPGSSLSYANFVSNVPTNFDVSISNTSSSIVNGPPKKLVDQSSTLLDNKVDLLKNSSNFSVFAEDTSFKNQIFTSNLSTSNSNFSKQNASETQSSSLENSHDTALLNSSEKLSQKATKPEKSTQFHENYFNSRQIELDKSTSNPAYENSIYTDYKPSEQPLYYESKEHLLHYEPKSYPSHNEPKDHHETKVQASLYEPKEHPSQYEEFQVTQSEQCLTRELSVAPNVEISKIHNQPGSLELSKSQILNTEVARKKLHYPDPNSHSINQPVIQQRSTSEPQSSMNQNQEEKSTLHTNQSINGKTSSFQVNKDIFYSPFAQLSSSKQETISKNLILVHQSTSKEVSQLCQNSSISSNQAVDVIPVTNQTDVLKTHVQPSNNFNSQSSLPQSSSVQESYPSQLPLPQPSLTQQYNYPSQSPLPQSSYKVHENYPSVPQPTYTAQENYTSVQSNYTPQYNTSQYSQQNIKQNQNNSTAERSEHLKNLTDIQSISQQSLNQIERPQVHQSNASQFNLTQNQMYPFNPSNIQGNLNNVQGVQDQLHLNNNFNNYSTPIPLTKEIPPTIEQTSSHIIGPNVAYPNQFNQYPVQQPMVYAPESFPPFNHYNLYGGIYPNAWPHGLEQIHMQQQYEQQYMDYYQQQAAYYNYYNQQLTAQFPPHPHYDYSQAYGWPGYYDQYSYTSSSASSVYESRPTSVIERQSSKNSDQALDELPDFSSELSFQHPEPKETEIKVNRSTPLSFTGVHLRARFNPIDGKLCIVAPKQPLDGEIAYVQNYALESIVPIPIHKRFPGPLLRGDTNKKYILRLVLSTVQEVLPTVYENENELVAQTALWEFVGLLVKQNGTFDGSDIADMLCSLISKTEVDGVKKSPLVHSYTPRVISEKNLEDYHQYMTTGQVRDGLEHTIRYEMWGHAFMLATSLGGRYLQLVQSRFMDSLKPSDPLKTLYSYLSGRDVEYFKKQAAVETWIQNLCILASNTSGNKQKDRERLIAFGDGLRDLHMVGAAHLCYLLAKLPFGLHTSNDSKIVLIGLEHRLHTTKQASVWAQPLNIQLTELYQFALTLNDLTFTIPAFQNYKFEYALQLMEYGYCTEALAYFESISLAILKEPSNEYYTQHLIKKIIKYAEQALLNGIKYYEDRDVPDWLNQLHALELSISSTCITSVFSGNNNLSFEHNKTGNVDSNQNKSNQNKTNVESFMSQHSHSESVRSSSTNEDSQLNVNGSVTETVQFNMTNGLDAISNFNANDNPYFIPDSNENVYNFNAEERTHYDDRQNNAYEASVYSEESSNERASNSREGYFNEQSLSYREGYQYGYLENDLAGYNNMWHNSNTNMNQVNDNHDYQDFTLSGQSLDTDMQTDSITEKQSEFQDSKFEPEEDLFSEFSKKKSNNAVNDNFKQEKNESSKKTTKPKQPVNNKKGWLGSIISKFTPAKEIHLPDDKDNSIYYDETLKRWVDKNENPAEARKALPPPPTSFSTLSTTAAAVLPPTAPTVVSDSKTLPSNGLPRRSSLSKRHSVTKVKPEDNSNLSEKNNAVKESAVSAESEKKVGPPSKFSMRAQGGNAKRGLRYVNAMGNNASTTAPTTVLDPFISAGTNSSNKQGNQNNKPMYFDPSQASS
ncbi:uncharacterized protein LOC100197480 isoform X1 [Hydra vulgaris]|uniref:uncharacterized protein LOC100197480 isoform X1 n=1 Tax=Hydra vulgaris TaxID=6087 RepID=UPI001F5E57A1|nr:uncharacterized protein LOC100197480 isoform X1 [Hydra vulgaris]